MFFILRNFYLLLLIFICLPAAIQAQDTAAILKELLDLPAPRPAAADSDKPDKTYGNIPPPDDAPIEDLKDYWSVKAAATYSFGTTPPAPASVKTALRLIEAARGDLAGFENMVKMFPADPDVAVAVKSVLDTVPAGEVGDDWRDKIKTWLKFNSTIFIQEVAADARRAKDHVEYTSITQEESVDSLARFDWETAKPLLEKLENDVSNPRTAVLALNLLYEHAIREKDADGVQKYREKLREVVEDRSAKPSARNRAMDALAAGGEWPGRDEWYLSLFEDETLFYLSEGSYGYQPLATISEKAPDKWIPVLVKLVGNKNRVVHNAAVANLMQFRSRRDALLPLLPWLTDPEWATVNWSPGGRNTLMQVVANLDMPESIPGLIWIVENDDEEARWAARSLGEIKDRRAGPALLARIEKTKNEDDREWMIEALIACEGLTDAEMVQAIQTYAEAVLRPGGVEKIDNRDEYAEEDPLPSRVSIGRFLAQKKAPPEKFVRMLFDHIRELRKSRPDVAAKLSRAAEKWHGKAVYVEMLQRAAEGSADGTAIVAILARRKEIREEAPLELSWLKGKSGLQGALGLAVLEDAATLPGLVNPDTPDAAIAALAFARLIRLKLPVRDIASLVQSKNKLLALAAERYLESENSPEARRVIFDARPDEMVVLGARETFGRESANAKYADVIKQLFSSLGQYYSGKSYDGMAKAEDRLRAELKEDKDLLHIYALATDGGPAGRVVRVYKNRATFTLYHDRSFYRQKTLTREDLDGFTKMLAEIDIDNFNPFQGGCHYDCYEREFVSLGRQGGLRVFAHSGPFAMGGLDVMEMLFDVSGYKLHYHLENEINGLEVLFADENGQMPIAVWKNGSDLRVLISDTRREREISTELYKLDEEDRKNEELGYKERERISQKRRSGREYEHLSWQRFGKAGLEGVTAEPAAVPYLRYRTAFPYVENFYSNDNVSQAQSRGYEVRAGQDDNSGVALANGSGTVVVRKDGWYRNPVTTADGKWAVISKTDSNWDDPHSLYRLDLATGREYRVELDPHRDLNAVSFIKAHNKILVRSADSYFLLDPRTGKLQPVKGEFYPLGDQTYRGLQPAGQPDKFWAAIPNSKKDETAIGKYDSKNFVFKPLLKLPKILLGSMAIWVDEREGFVYFVYGESWQYQAHLLRVPLNAVPSKTPTVP
jgi:HEAT repeat protein